MKVDLSAEADEDGQEVAGGAVLPIAVLGPGIGAEQVLGLVGETAETQQLVDVDEEVAVGGDRRQPENLCGVPMSIVIAQYATQTALVWGTLLFLLHKGYCLHFNDVSCTENLQL